MVIGIIGGGASGMAAALTAAQNKDVQIVLMERQARVGRKLQATGNGRCNLTNLHASEGGYHGEEPSFAAYAIGQFGPEETLNWFRSLGRGKRQGLSLFRSGQFRAGCAAICSGNAQY